MKSCMEFGGDETVAEELPECSPGSTGRKGRACALVGEGSGYAPPVFSASTILGRQTPEDLEANERICPRKSLVLQA